MNFYNYLLSFQESVHELFTQGSPRFYVRGKPDKLRGPGIFYLQGKGNPEFFEVGYIGEVMIFVNLYGRGDKNYFASCIQQCVLNMHFIHFRGFSSIFLLTC